MWGWRLRKEAIILPHTYCQTWIILFHGPLSNMDHTVPWTIVKHGSYCSMDHYQTWIILFHGPLSNMVHTVSWTIVKQWIILFHGPLSNMDHTVPWTIVKHGSYCSMDHNVDGDFLTSGKYDIGVISLLLITHYISNDNKNFLVYVP